MKRLFLPLLPVAPLLLAAFLLGACGDRGAEPGGATGEAPAELPAVAEFAPPAPGDTSLEPVRELIKAFLAAPDWPTRLAHSYQGESRRETMAAYHRDHAYVAWPRHTVSFYQMVTEPGEGGPFWMYVFSPSDGDPGWPVMVRIDGGLLKVDGASFHEFADRHFAKFRESADEGPESFRLVAERLTGYDESDRAALGDLGAYDVYRLDPPYGETDAYRTLAFVEKDSPAGRALAGLLPLGSEPLALTLSLAKRDLGQGGERVFVEEVVREGWFE